MNPIRLVTEKHNSIVDLNNHDDPHIVGRLSGISGYDKVVHNSLTSKHNLKGKVFGALTVIGQSKSKYDIPHWVSLCKCGSCRAHSEIGLLDGSIQDCGCVEGIRIHEMKGTKPDQRGAEATHGSRKHPLYSRWYKAVNSGLETEPSWIDNPNLFIGDMLKLGWKMKKPIRRKNASKGWIKDNIVIAEPDQKQKKKVKPEEIRISSKMLLTTIRKDHELTQNALANIIGVSKRTIIRKEKSKSLPTISELELCTSSKPFGQITG